MEITTENWNRLPKEVQQQIINSYQQEPPKKRLPKYKATLQIALWENTDKKGNKYLSAQMPKYINFFPYEDKKIIEGSEWEEDHF